MNHIQSSVSDYTARIFHQPVTLAEKICSFISNNRYLLLGATVLVGGSILYFLRTSTSAHEQEDNEDMEKTASEARELANQYTSNYGEDASTQLRSNLEAPNPRTPQKQKTIVFAAYCLVMNEKETASKYETSDEYRHDLESK